MRGEEAPAGGEATEGRGAPERRRPGVALRPLALLIALIAIAAMLPAFDRQNALVVFPRDWTLDLATPLGDGLKYLARDFAILGLPFSSITRGIGWLVGQPFELLRSLLADGFVFYRDGGAFTIPPLPWSGVTLAAVIVAARVGSPGLALWTGATFVYFAVFGLWEAAMMTLASVSVSVAIATAGGLQLGLWGYRNRTVDAVLQPLYDVMQTLPLFSYLVPMILFFGFGPIASFMATVVFALPPMARVATQAMRDTPRSVIELGRVTGCSRAQMTWLVLTPAARERLLLGVNQVIMLSLAVVIVASLIGAGGLGGDVLKALKSVRIGDAVAAGFAIVFMAVTLDRVSTAVALRRPVHAIGPQPWIRRWSLGLGCAAALLGAMLLSLALPAAHAWPESLTLSTGAFWNDLISWISATFRAEIEGLRDGAIGMMMRPTKIFFLSAPWLAVVAFFAALGWALGGWRLALLGGGVFLAIALGGYWKKAMLSLYLVALSVVFASLIGVALGVLAGLSDRAQKALIFAVDIIQTLPTFVYLIPVVMLFSIGDFPALVAIVLYAVAPMVRYTAAGLRSVRPSLIESARMSGCDGLQLLLQVRLPLALPTLLLGLNQVVMMAFGMLVITALVGTRGLEEATLVAIAKVAPGDGLLAGLAIAGMAIVLDRLLKAANRHLARSLGLPPPQ